MQQQLTTCWQQLTTIANNKGNLGMGFTVSVSAVLGKNEAKCRELFYLVVTLKFVCCWIVELKHLSSVSGKFDCCGRVNYICYRIVKHIWYGAVKLFCCETSKLSCCGKNKLNCCQTLELIAIECHTKLLDNSQTF